MVDETEFDIMDADTRDDGDTCEDCSNWKASNRCKITDALVFYDHKKCEEFEPKLNT